MARVQGRTQAQLRDDRDAAKCFAGWAIQSDIDEGLKAACSDHGDDWVHDCPRCQWVNDEIQRIAMRLGVA